MVADFLRHGLLLQNFRRASLGFVAQILQQITGSGSPCLLLH